MVLARALYVWIIFVRSLFMMGICFRLGEFVAERETCVSDAEAIAWTTFKSENRFPISVENEA